MPGQRWAGQLVYIYIAPADLCNKLSRPSHCCGTTGLKSSFRPLRVLSHAGTVSFSNRAPLVWNSCQHRCRVRTLVLSSRQVFC